jgi:hypothetical protein
MAAKKKAPAKPEFESFDDSDDAVEESWDGETVDIDEPTRGGAVPPGVKLRDWRDVERYREERELRKLIEDDLDLDDLDGPRRRRRA